MNNNDYINTVSDLSVPMSKFDMTRPSNFHRVLKTSVLIFTTHVHRMICHYDYEEIFAEYKFK